MNKRCPICKKTKLFSDFHNNRSSKDGKHSRCADCRRIATKKYRETYGEQIKKRHKTKEYKDWRRQYNKTRKHKNWRSQHNKTKKCKNQRSQYLKECRENPFFRLNGNMSNNIYQSLCNGKNGRHWETIVGYKLRELKEHLENSFQSGMNWENYGQWHVDHIIPISLWRFESPDDSEFKQCWALCNLQPLWAEENMRKSNNVA